ncbi:hypothetical protein TorRG33x02_014950 [Trema orientale]|uniref:Uncharacterized protein n=1 Tax=Trema orientale TaxID=63057 RepID=A0A2P5FXI4_TREOI|nr:hypothetical protein TorRG33x02_014950 [Trema orientale]
MAASKTARGLSLAWIDDGSGLSLAWIDDGSDRFQSCPNISQTDLESLSNFGDLCWECQFKVMEVVKNSLKFNDKAYHSRSSENFIEPLVAFSTDARTLMI